MGWKRYRRKINRQIKRSGQQAKGAWDRYKDEIIMGAAMLGGAVLAPVTLGASIPVGAMLGATAAGAGQAAYQGHKAEKEAEKQMKAMEGGLSDQYSLRRMRRAGGDAVIDFDSNVPNVGAA